MSRTAMLAVLALVLAGCSANQPSPDRGPAPVDATTVENTPDSPLATATDPDSGPAGPHVPR